MPAPDGQAFEVGSTANSYQILAKLATGGMAEIFLARSAAVAGVERYVVLKRILRNRSTDVHFVRMFLDEARLAAQLQHPNVAQVYDIGKLGDSFFFTMEYVHGETVRALMHRAYANQRRVPISSVLTTIAGAAAGLHHAHERVGVDGKKLNVVHRDVSPSNLMISYEGAVKLVDFGVAKAAHRIQETHAGTVKGKIGYLSPEQCRGKAIDRRSDLFSLGIVMWEMLCGERLYRKESDFDNMQSIVGDAPVPPSRTRDDVPPEIDAIVMKLLAKSPDQRFQTGDELLETIENASAKLGMALSATALGRLVRELFGKRPEPWIEMRAIEAHPEIVTVTVEPIPENLDGVLASMMESQLAHVPDLSTKTGASWGGDVTPVPQRATSQSKLPPPVVPASAPHDPLTSTRIPVGAIEGTGVRMPRLRRAYTPIFVVSVAAIIGMTAFIALRSGKSSDASPEAPPPRPVAALAADASANPPPARDVATAPASVSTPIDPHPAPPPPPPADDIESLFRAGRYADAVVACGATAKLGDALVQCALSACRVKDLARARRWASALPAKQRVGLARECVEAPRPIARPSESPRPVVKPSEPPKPVVKPSEPPKPVVKPPATKPNCDESPLDCQH